MYRNPSAPTSLVVAHKVNHVVLCVDMSSSIDYYRLTEAVIQVVDNYIKFLADYSKQMDQETRVSVIVFSTAPRCVIFDTDVLRLPSIRSFYRPQGNTALIDATLLAFDDLALLPEKYGDHANWITVFTDGEETVNTGKGPTLASRIQHLPDNYTLACFVPGHQAKMHAQAYGFPAKNIEVWDATSKKGLEAAEKSLQDATTTYFTARSTGSRSVTNLFDISAAKVNATSVAKAGLQPVSYDDYDLVPVPPLPGLTKPEDYDQKKRRKPWVHHGGEIGEFVRKIRGGQYIVGQAFYPLVEGRTVIIQPSKKLAVLHKASDRVYYGEGVRDMLGLDKNNSVRVKPSGSDEYQVYVQSKAENRQLVTGTKLLIFKKSM